MKMSHLLGERFKETPSDCQIASHALMMRGGYMRQLCNGIYSLYPPAPDHPQDRADYPRGDGCDRWAGGAVPRCHASFPMAGIRPL